jgi:vitamin B12 transporter
VRKSLLLLTTLLTTAVAFAEEVPEIQVTATRVEVPVEHIGDDVEIITEEEIKKYGFSSITDVLKYVAGIHISSNGGFGQTTSVYMLGLPSKHILVMIDGVPINDPSNVDSQANFAYIDLSNVERIEVLKGAQGALYGSEAIAGVINIITKKPKKNEFRFGFEGGRYETFKENVYSSLKFNDGYLLFSVENFKTNGFSATNNRAGIFTYDPDNDGYNYRTAWFSYGWNLNEFTKIRGSFRLKDGKAEYDSAKCEYDPTTWALIGCEPYSDTYTTYYNYFANIKVDSALTDSLLLTANFGNNKEERTAIDSSGEGNYTGITRYSSMQLTYYLQDKLIFASGFSYKQEIGSFSGDYPSWGTNMKAEGRLYTRSIFGEIHSSYYNLHTTLALRRDFHSQFGAKTTYKISAVYTISRTKTTLKGQYGTGFRAPSPYQLYAISISPWGETVLGNPHLRAETSENWILGIKQQLSVVKGEVEANYFKNHIWDPIVYDSSADPKYQNANKGITEGMEVKLSFKVLQELDIFGSYTHQRLSGDDAFVLRRPEDSYVFGFNIKRGDFKFSFWGEHYSSRKDKDFSSNHYVSLSPFTTYNCYASYQLNNRVNFYLKGINLTDKNYELAYGYNTMGRALFAGVKVSFE